MTLKEFAAHKGINYRTAQTWLRRGRIQKKDSGFELLQDSGFKDSEPRGHQDSKGEMISESLNPESCAKCESLQRQVDDMRAALGVSNASLIESNNAVIEMQGLISGLRSRVTALELANEGRSQDLATLYREMRDRTAMLPDPPDWRGATSAPIDPPSSGWGP